MQFVREIVFRRVSAVSRHSSTTVVAAVAGIVVAGIVVVYGDATFALGKCGERNVIFLRRHASLRTCLKLLKREKGAMTGQRRMNFTARYEL